MSPQVPGVAAEVCCALDGRFQDMAINVLSNFFDIAMCAGVLVNEQQRLGAAWLPPSLEVMSTSSTCRPVLP